MNEFYGEEINNSWNARTLAIKDRLQDRNNNGNYELHFHIDTSYERRRVGSYDKNGEVTTYMNGLASNIINKFNTAAPNWDVVHDLTVTFFDGQTPFSYGSNMLATLENYTDWLIANNFPGNDDMYVFYSGQYTNSGISYVGVMCIPGISVVGFVSSLTPNEALSSHEWIGHSCNALHFDSVSNIMNSFNATFPWHIKSLNVIEDYLENAGCVDNVQVPLSLMANDWSIACNEELTSVNWIIRDSNYLSKIVIQQSSDQYNWTNVYESTLANSTVTLIPERNLGKWFRITTFYKDNHEFFSDAKYYNFCKKLKNIYLLNKVLVNPFHQLISVYNSSGQEVLKTSEEYKDLNQWPEGSLVIVISEDSQYKFILN